MADLGKTERRIKKAKSKKPKSRQKVAGLGKTERQIKKAKSKKPKSRQKMADLGKKGNRKWKT